LREQPDSSGRLPPRAVELVVEVGVLELVEVERRGVAHQAHARHVREEVAEQTLDERGGAGQRLAHDREHDFDRHEPPQPREVCFGRAPERHHLVNDELADPQHGHGDEGAHEPERDHPGRHAAVRVPDEFDEGRDVAERLDPLAHGRPRDGVGLPPER
jgi:hypothetical protein